MSQIKRYINSSPIRNIRVTGGTYAFTVVTVAIIGFTLGLRYDDLARSVGPFFGAKSDTSNIDFTAVQKTYRELRENYDGSMDMEKLVDGASRGLTAAAGDQWTVFMDKKEAEEFDKALKGDIGAGIGAEINTRDNQPTIIRTLPDNPAQVVGLKAGDVIVSVNDESTVGQSSEKTAQMIRGEAGTTVMLKVLRSRELREFTIVRAKINNPSVSSKVIDNIGVMTISRFDEETGGLARKAASSLKSAGVKGVILDLRGNGGGYLTAAQDVAGLWLNNKVVVTERAGGKVTDSLYSGTNPVLSGVPTAVLVNDGSASASEIVAGALKDYKAATLIGEKTFGKGSVQKLIDLPGGNKLKVTIARWYTPNGKNITKEGIEPNQKVALSFDDTNAGRDPQMDSAIKTLSE